MSDREAFYIKLKGQLEDTTTFPTKYLFKFIVPTDENQAEEVKEVFNNGGAVIKTKQSKTGKYNSLSIFLNVKSAQEVITYYKRADVIKGIISL
ncbi:DUF493 family protein [Tenacibaculum finnmarkense]|uniref:DUF493 family protein n=1 Tax=Tenacibaculum finnmarkense genomovar finnmarkense TaxID=1458503 RepID=A0AAP1REY4_9FLAO|nr:DUF493 family protein [Tenacibaculum finnmarkense]MBE7652604.1 DUF493 family protein [Tenacibaculum finnmarkense genomovar finnmarkense]MBE7660251.1 DUF493 family protein [Tenacibaculum finnmarkense genomovar finnmarkense]MBE7694903.1 DUF493 family protein [Tenacibaculum finnmarkense genomovar finnmarkense]MCD8402895.1 DUF493 family protein [Tenacibaculum finnmarkense genomovar finnmarkense]MCD8412199.1 DUF493 family protein [Tenacibaculum finnmarkense genomovar ulcerans]